MLLVCCSRFLHHAALLHPGVDEETGLRLPERPGQHQLGIDPAAHAAAAGKELKKKQGLKCFGQADLYQDADFLQLKHTSATL